MKLEKQDITEAYHISLEALDMKIVNCNKYLHGAAEALKFARENEWVLALIRQYIENEKNNLDSMLLAAGGARDDQKDAALSAYLGELAKTEGMKLISYEILNASNKEEAVNAANQAILEANDNLQKLTQIAEKRRFQAERPNLYVQLTPSKIGIFGAINCFVFVILLQAYGKQPVLSACYYPDQSDLSNEECFEDKSRAKVLAFVAHKVNEHSTREISTPMALSFYEDCHNDVCKRVLRSWGVCLSHVNNDGWCGPESE